jgi:glucose-6-phosphate-specific signal transduction histidine kinase
VPAELPELQNQIGQIADELIGTPCYTCRDDGIGGADTARGSGLIGLRDRVQALGGSIEISSPRGSGTAILVMLPLQPNRPLDQTENTP